MKSAFLAQFFSVEFVAVSFSHKCLIGPLLRMLTSFGKLIFEEQRVRVGHFGRCSVFLYSLNVNCARNRLPKNLTVCFFANRFSGIAAFLPKSLSPIRAPLNIPRFHRQTPDPLYHRRLREVPS